MRTLSILLACSLLSGCFLDNPFGSDPPTVAGRWSATYLGEQISFTLVDTEGVVNGSGSWGADAINLSGTFADPDISLTITFSQYQPVNFSGTFSNEERGATLTGRFNGSGFNNFSIAFRRISE